MHLPSPSPPPLDFEEAVHQLAGLVPAGRILTYKDVAELLGRAGPRQVGKAMQGTAPGSPWWRIIRADGNITASLLEQARAHWDQERMPRRGGRVDVARARWQPNDRQWRQIQELSASLDGPRTSRADEERPRTDPAFGQQAGRGTKTSEPRDGMEP